MGVHKKWINKFKKMNKITNPTRKTGPNPRKDK